MLFNGGNIVEPFPTSFILDIKSGSISSIIGSNCYRTLNALPRRNLGFSSDLTIHLKSFENYIVFENILRPIIELKSADAIAAKSDPRYIIRYKNKIYLSNVVSNVESAVRWGLSNRLGYMGLQMPTVLLFSQLIL